MKYSRLLTWRGGTPRRQTFVLTLHVYVNQILKSMKLLEFDTKFSNLRYLVVTVPGPMQFTNYIFLAS